MGCNNCLFSKICSDKNEKRITCRDYVDFIEPVDAELIREQALKEYLENQNMNVRKTMELFGQARCTSCIYSECEEKSFNCIKNNLVDIDYRRTKDICSHYIDASEAMKEFDNMSREQIRMYLIANDLYKSVTTSNDPVTIAVIDDMINNALELIKETVVPNKVSYETGENDGKLNLYVFNISVMIVLELFCDILDENKIVFKDIIEHDEALYQILEQVGIKLDYDDYILASSMRDGVAGLIETTITKLGGATNALLIYLKFIQRYIDTTSILFRVFDIFKNNKILNTILVLHKNDIKYEIILEVTSQELKDAGYLAQSFQEYKQNTGGK